MHTLTDTDTKEHTQTHNRPHMSSINMETHAHNSCMDACKCASTHMNVEDHTNTRTQFKSLEHTEVSHAS